MDIPVWVMIALFFLFADRIYDKYKIIKHGQPLTFSELIIILENSKDSQNVEIANNLKSELSKIENKLFVHRLGSEKRIVKEIAKIIKNKEYDD